MPTISAHDKKKLSKSRCKKLNFFNLAYTYMKNFHAIRKTQYTAVTKNTVNAIYKYKKKAKVIDDHHEEPTIQSRNRQICSQKT